jgi:hypothetical protein
MASLLDSQLSALAASIDDLSKRVAQLADGLPGQGGEEAATALYEAERSLLMANRAMERARRTLPG